jgi:AraC-like DNA-binding protein
MITNKLKALTFTELLNGANLHYSEGYLSRYFDVKAGRSRSGSGDTLAQFIVRELREGFDSTYSRERQVDAAVLALERAKEDLQCAIDGLREL